MMRKQKLLLVALVAMLIIPSFLVYASSSTNSSAEKVDVVKGNGELASKDEVVYATLQANGKLDEVYIVNILDVAKAGEVIDYGVYSNIKNLTDLSEINQANDIIRINAPKGKFYYQGNTTSIELPWEISITYLLNGAAIQPEELPGKDGNVQISIATKANEKVNPVFFENYLLQISVMLETDVFSNIEAPDGMMANVGKNKQVTFTVMPEQESELTLAADAIEFELQGIEIAAIPSTMSIDAPDIDEMTEDMDTLAEAIKELNNGVVDLNKGVSQLNDGVTSFRDGSQSYLKGMTDIDQASVELVGASETIGKALATISESLDVGEMDLSELTQLPQGLTQIANGLGETAAGLTTLRENYTVANNALNDAIMSIPDHAITESEIQGLYMSGADGRVLDQLIETYTKALTAKGMYQAVKEGFHAVDTTLQIVSGSIKEMGNTLAVIAEGFSESIKQLEGLQSLSLLQSGLNELSANYGQFHSGLVSYTDGVSLLATSYYELHEGAVELSEGTNELVEGVAELYEGTDLLYDATKDLPEQMQEEIDKMISEYDRSDFQAVSFVSTNIEKINSVQFVIKTAGIKKVEEEIVDVQLEEEKGFLSRLLDLFF